MDVALKVYRFGKLSALLLNTTTKKHKVIITGQKYLELHIPTLNFGNYRLAAKSIRSKKNILEAIRIPSIGLKVRRID